MSVTIALVDDDRNILTSVSIALQAEGFVTRVYSDGEAALKALDGTAKHASAMILDLSMPGLDGLGVLKAMRERGISIPVIVQTAQGGLETAISAMRAGAFDFVVKPAAPERLRASIADALKVQALDAGLRQALAPVR